MLNVLDNQQILKGLLEDYYQKPECFCNGVLEIVSPYPRNKTTKHMLRSLSCPSSFSYSNHEWQQEGL